MSNGVKDGDVAQVRLLIAQGEDVNDYVPGTKMRVDRVKEAEDRANLIAFLKRK